MFRLTARHHATGERMVLDRIGSFVRANSRVHTGNGSATRDPVPKTWSTRRGAERAAVRYASWRPVVEEVGAE